MTVLVLLPLAGMLVVVVVVVMMEQAKQKADNSWLGLFTKGLVIVQQVQLQELFPVLVRLINIFLNPGFFESRRSCSFEVIRPCATFGATQTRTIPAGYS